MGVVKNLMVRAGADFSAITQQANKASKSMKGMQSSVSRSCNLMTKAASGMKKVLGAIGVGLSAAAIVSFGKEAATAYDTQVQGEMKLATVMRNTMGASNAEIQSIMDLVAAQQELGIVSDSAQLAGAQELATYVKQKTTLETLIPVMNDMAVQQYGYNVTAQETANIAMMLGKVMNGQVSGLSRLGYSFDDAQKAVLKYGTETERAAMLAKVVGESVNGMNAALASTPTGRMQQLKSTMGDIKGQFGQAVRTIGTVFLPVLNAVAKVLAWIATMANKVAQAVANVFGGTVAGKEWQWSGVSAGISETADAVDDLTDAQYGSASAAEKQKEALQTASFDTLNILKATDTAGSGGGGGGGYGGGGAGSSPINETETAAEEAGGTIGWLQEKLEKLKTKWEEFKSGLDLDRLKATWGDLKEAVKGFCSAISEILKPLWDNILKPLATWIINTALPGILKVLAETINFISKAIGTLKDVIGKVKEAIKAFGESLSNFGQRIKGAFGEAKETVKADLQNISTSATDLGRRIRDAWNDIKESVNRGRESISTGLQNLIAAFRDSDKSILDSFADLARRIGTAWSDIKASFTRGKESIGNGFQNLVSSIKTAGQHIFDGMTWPFQKAYDWITGFIDKLKKKLNFSWSIPRPKLPHVTFKWDRLKVGDWLNIPIPKFSVDWYAKGGVFDRASLIGVGENGKEAVVPLEKNTGWISKVASELAAQMAGGSGLLGGEALIEGIHDAVYEAMMAVMGMQGRSGSHKTVVSVNGREFYRATWDDYKAVARERGVSLINT